MDSSLLPIEDDLRSTSTSSSAMSPADKARACCQVHPVIQLRRWNRKTGEWKSLLESCPLCDASAFLASEGVQVQAGSSSSSTSRTKSRLSEQVSDLTIDDSRTCSRTSTSSSRRLRRTPSSINPSSSPPRRSSSYQHIPKSSTDNSNNEDDERSVSSRSVSSSVYAFASSLPSVSARTSPSTDGPATDDELTEDEESCSASIASDLRRARRLRPALRRGSSSYSSLNNSNLSVRFTPETKTPTEGIVADWVNDLSSSSGRLRGLLEGGGGIDTSASPSSMPKSVLRPSSFGSSTNSAPTPKQQDNKDLCIPSLDASSDYEDDDDDNEGYDSENHYDRKEAKVESKTRRSFEDEGMIHYHSHDEGENKDELETDEELETDDEEPEEKETPTSSPVQPVIDSSSAVLHHHDLDEYHQDLLQQQLRNHGSVAHVPSSIPGGKWPIPPPPPPPRRTSSGVGSATSSSPLISRKTHSLSSKPQAQGQFTGVQQNHTEQYPTSPKGRLQGSRDRPPSSVSERVPRQYNQGGSAQDRPLQQQQRNHQRSTTSQQGPLSQLPGGRSSSRARGDERSISSQQGPLPQLSGGRSSSRARGEERSTQQRQQQLPRSQSQSRPRSSSALRGIRNSTSSSLSQSDSNVNGKPITGILRTRRTNDVPTQWQHQTLSHQPSQHQLAQFSHFQHQPPSPKPSNLSSNSTSHMTRRPTLDSSSSNYPPHNTSKSWHTSKDLSKSDSETQESTEPSGESNPIGESNSYPRQATNTRGSENGLILEPSTYDDKGRCMKHPHIRLRKKKLMGGWKVVLVNCPDCCIEEMLRMRLEEDGNNGGGNTKSVSRRDRDGMPGGGEDKNFRRRDSRESVNTSTSSKKNIPPITQLVIRSHGKFDDTSVISDTTYNTPPEDLQGSRSSLLSKNTLGPVNEYPPGSFYNGPHRVSRMPFTDAYGDKGWYTGEVASGSGLPHGRGTLHYCDGRVCETRWSNGLTAGVGGGAPPRRRHPQRRPLPSALVVTESYREEDW